MIIVGGTFELDPAQRAAFLDGRVELMRSSRAEPGCLEYTFSADPVEPARVLLYERWESQEALDQHLAGLKGKPRPNPDITPAYASIVMYDVAAERSFGR